MKKFLTIFTWLLLGLSLFVAAQEVKVLSEEIDFRGDINQSQRKTIILHNETDQSQTYFLKNLRGNIGSSQNVKICIGDNCFDSKRDLAKIKINLAPGEIMTDMYLEFEMGIMETRGSFDLFFVNEKNIREAFVVEAKYDVKGPTLAEEGFTHDAISITDVYPNPSQRIAQIDYEIKDQDVKARIAINSFIGNPIQSYTLDPERNTLLINVSDFNPGVYFYTLFVDNKNVVTKKLVVKK
ncbi:T9SS type A sorting domain-containing protein [Algoriphagus namhaensis]|uniref:T9SS type A sorting domain-containing protein n=1 Tax=Algoriphagus namhaensis TaxID=915353 RepID=A0ABV8ANN7_9BACT